jgi:DNA-binding transcriptional MerR regulator
MNALRDHTLSIGDFSRMTQLTVKTLRHYHEVGLVVPARIDPSTGYRYYSPAQVPTAQVVRRLRELNMPIADVRAVLASEPGERNVLISGHLGRLEQELATTRSAVESLRAILDRPGSASAIEHRSVPATPAVAVQATVDRDDLIGFWQGAVEELRAIVAADRLRQTGALGALFGFGIFDNDRGAATVFIPVEDGPFTVPPAELAVIRHRGPHDDVDLAYSELGSYATRHEISVDGPLREYYECFSWDTPDASQWSTDLCWPVFRSDASDASDGGAAS